MNAERHVIAARKHANFVRVVSPRVDKAIEAIDRIGRCGNRTAYEYSDAEAEQIFGALQEALDNAYKNYSSRVKPKREPFCLNTTPEYTT